MVVRFSAANNGGFFQVSSQGTMLMRTLPQTSKKQLNDLALCGQFLYAIGTDYSGSYQTAFVFAMIAYPNSPAYAYAQNTTTFTWSEPNADISGLRITCDPNSMNVLVAGNVGTRNIYLRSIDPVSGKTVLEKRLYDASIDGMVTEGNITAILGTWYSSLYSLPDGKNGSSFAAVFPTNLFPIAPTWVNYVQPGVFQPGKVGQSITTDGFGNVLIAGVNSTTTSPTIYRMSISTGAVNNAFSFNFPGASNCPHLQATGDGFMTLCNYNNGGDPKFFQYSPCTDCPLGSYSDGTKACQKCPTGTYSPTPRSDSIAYCFTCNLGTYQPKEGAASDTECLPCPAGTYSDSFGIANETQCIPCPAGTFSSQAGAMGSYDCSMCTGITYAPKPGSTSCTPCPPRTVPRYGDPAVCEACPESMYVDTVSQSCQSCPFGKFCGVGSNNNNAMLTTFIDRAPKSVTKLFFSDIRDVASDSKVTILTGTAIGAAIAVGVVLTAIALIIFAVTAPCIKTGAPSKIDFFFGEKHDTPDNSPLISKKTSLGGYVSVITIIVIIVVIAILIILFLLKNSVFTETQTTEKIEYPTGLYKLAISFYHQEVDCTGNITVTGFVIGVVDSGFTPFSSLDGGKACLAYWKCDSCTMTGAEVRFTATLVNPGVSSVAFNYSASVPYYSGSQYEITSAPFFAPIGTTFRGKTPSAVFITATPTKFVTLSNPIFTSISQREQHVLKLIHVGYNAGSYVQNSEYNEAPDILTASIVVSTSAITSTIVESQQTPIQTLLINLINYAGLVISIFAMGFPYAEGVMDKVKDKLSGKKRVPVLPASPVTPYSEELRDSYMPPMTVESIDSNTLAYPTQDEQFANAPKPQIGSNPPSTV